MGTSIGTDNPTIVSAFHAALVHQGVVVVVILALLAVAWNVLRSSALRRAALLEPAAAAAPRIVPEPPGRRLARVSFALLWIFDGVLQGQDAMPLGLTSKVVQPAASGSPAWVQHLVGSGVTIWSFHPVEAAASAVWIQLGIGLWLLVAPRGAWSRVAGVASVGWGALVWVLGEAFGGVLAPGATWMLGVPGAALFYVLAGALVALPERSFATPRLGRVVLGVMGAYFLGMSLLQAWPGRGFWHGRGAHGVLGPIAAMTRSMSHTPQPRLLSSLVASFASFDAAHGWGVNLFVVAALALVGAGLLSGRPRAARYASTAGVVLCLADWVLVQDLGFLGGVGTDPNSMVPTALLLLSGYVAATRLPARSEDPGVVVALPSSALSLRERLRASPTYAFRSLAALGAVAIALLGAAPMAAASVNHVADPILSQAVDGAPSPLDYRAPSFTLTDQSGRSVSLAGLRGKVVALTFLDPVCTSDCPVIAQELRQTDAMLGSAARRVELVAVVANPIYRSLAATRAFDRAEGLSHVANWMFLTGSLRSLRQVWNEYAVQLVVAPGGAMVAHSEIAYVIGPSGRAADALSTVPGSGSASTRSSFSGVLATLVRRVLAS
ncbi:MAG: SCO family protein [Actinomycetota bacterium]|nr:SCO family protein [Actinomycetota bacterium]